MSTAKHPRAGIAMIVLGFLAFITAPYGVYHYRDEAAKRADSYVAEHQYQYKSDDFARAFDGYLEETRVQRWGFFAVHLVEPGRRDDCP